MTNLRKLRPARIVPALAAAAALSALGAPAMGQLPEGLSVHGFLTQAYGRSDGHQIIGIGSDGTADYRVAALQFRYAYDARSAFVIQLSHERIGRSPLGDLEPEVDLDWVFYEHRFDDYTIGRVGRVRNPIGIYNEFRDVGTLLPFYRPPIFLYGEQMYASETVDGMTLGRRFPLGDWELSVDGFVGSWSFLQIDLATRATVDLGYGAQVWLQTPLDGLRVGAAGMRYTVRNSFGAPADSEDQQVLLAASLDGRFGPVGVRSEFRHVGFGGDELGYTGTAAPYYGELTLNVTDRLTLMGQAQWQDFAIEIPAFMLSMDENLERDLSVGVRYAHTPNVVLKLEGHRYSGRNIEDQVIFPWDERVGASYALFSVSTSF
ncbi:MAG TPA: hypothetical protein VM198_09000 [Longimicrobiales bacterium]|nr:hypothetical protein [Longimicrobiales bacterium]